MPHRKPSLLLRIEERKAIDGKLAIIVTHVEYSAFVVIYVSLLIRFILQSRLWIRTTRIWGSKEESECDLFDVLFLRCIFPAASSMLQNYCLCLALRAHKPVFLSMYSLKVTKHVRQRLIKMKYSVFGYEFCLAVAVADCIGNGRNNIK